MLQIQAAVYLAGGRYLLDTWENAVGYDTFTGKELEFEPGVKFGDRPFFLGVDRHVWRVTGAHDFTPLVTVHYTSRFERWTMWLPQSRLAGGAPSAFPLLRSADPRDTAKSRVTMLEVDHEEIVDTRLRRYYRLTPAGRSRLAAEAARLRANAAAASQRLRLAGS